MKARMETKIRIYIAKEIQIEYSNDSNERLQSVHRFMYMPFIAAIQPSIIRSCKGVIIYIVL